MLRRNKLHFEVFQAGKIKWLIKFLINSLCSGKSQRLHFIPGQSSQLWNSFPIQSCQSPACRSRHTSFSTASVHIPPVCQHVMPVFCWAYLRLFFLVYPMAWMLAQRVKLTRVKATIKTKAFWWPSRAFVPVTGCTVPMLETCSGLFAAWQQNANCFSSKGTEAVDLTWCVQQMEAQHRFSSCTFSLLTQTLTFKMVQEQQIKAETEKKQELCFFPPPAVLLVTNKLPVSTALC